MRREVQALVVHCTFMDDGCEWKGEVRHLEVHNISYFANGIWLNPLTPNVKEQILLHVSCPHT